MLQYCQEDTMDFSKAVLSRHSVRSYLNKQIDKETVAKLQSEVDAVNKESGLNVQLLVDEPEAFSCFLAHYGKFKNVSNYFAMVGKDTKDLQEKVGYFGERLVLYAQILGLNTCWVALTYSRKKSRAKIEKGEKLMCVIALGYGETQGIQHRSKPLEKLYVGDADEPEWFMDGVRCASLAPTAMNQQKFVFSHIENRVKAVAGKGFYSKLDLGIAKFHFEIGAGKENFEFI